MWAVLCIGVIWVLVAVRRGYSYLPDFEMRRRGTRGNTILHRLADIAPYQASLVLVLNSLICLFSAVFVLITSRSYSIFTALLLFAVAGLGYRYLSQKNIAVAVKFAAWLSVYILKYVRKLHQLQKRFNKPKRVVTHIYEREDLKKLIQHQKSAINNRIDHSELDAVLKLLEFEQHKISSVMVPYKAIRFVNAKESIGPILLSELHKTGFKQFPVQGNAKHDILGIISLKTVAHYDEGGLVTDAMDSTVLYVRDNQPLERVVQAFTKTGKDMFIVVNAREKVVGLITICDVLEAVIGTSIYDDFDGYDDREAVSQQT
jgi:CBS domain containing-hemolysin-like protein